MSRFWCFSLWYITCNSSKHQSIVLERVAYHEKVDFCLFFKKKKASVINIHSNWDNGGLIQINLKPAPN